MAVSSKTLKIEPFGKQYIASFNGHLLVADRDKFSSTLWKDTDKNGKYDTKETNFVGADLSINSTTTKIEETETIEATQKRILSELKKEGNKLKIQCFGLSSSYSINVNGDLQIEDVRKNTSTTLQDTDKNGGV